jgi:hypothetical protein
MLSPWLGSNSRKIIETIICGCAHTVTYSYFREKTTIPCIKFKEIGKLQFFKGKTAISIALFLILSFAVSLVAIPAANAHTPPNTYATYAQITAEPNPIGVGQQVEIVMLIDIAFPGAALNNDIRPADYTLTIIAPNGKTETNTYPVYDPGSSRFILYTPDQTGTYIINFTYPGQIFNFGGAYQGDTYLSSSAQTNLTVQTEPIAKLPTTPLPTEYWTRPIEAVNTLWEPVASNWIGGAATSDIWQKSGSAPMSAHIMWTKPIEFGGLTGGITTQAGDGENDTGATFYSGFSYETRFANPMIIGGILYYNAPLNHAGSGGGYYAVDLRTGEEVWTRDDLNSITTGGPSKAQLEDFQSPDQHGVVGGILWQTVGSTWNAYDAFTGKYIFNMTNVPSGTEVYTNTGEIVRYVLNYDTTTRSGWLALWNDSAAISNSPASILFGAPAGWRPVGQSINASINEAYSWNATITADLSGTSRPAIVGVIPDDLLLGRSSNIGLVSQPNPNSNPWTMWALNLNASKGAIGSLLWVQNYSAPAGNITRMLDWQPIDPINRVWIMTDFETGQRLGYSLDTGDLLWGPVGPTDIGFQYYSSREGQPAYGNLYVTGYGGIVYCYSTKNGTLLWTYGNGGPGNSTNSLDETPWGHYPIHSGGFADGVFFTFAGEHSPNTPMYKGERVRAIDAFTGKELWTLLGWSASGLGTSVPPIAIADGYLIYDNAYGGQIYCIGKGPSATTVQTPLTATVAKNTVVIQGAVTDIAAGTKQKEQAARFPNGVPAVSDASMTAWMEYVYMQQPLPLDATGVNVTLDAIDPNDNCIHIGNVTSDANGLFSYAWETPDVPGKYTVVATFAGSESYWPSSAETAMYVSEMPAATPAPTPMPASLADIYLLPATIAIIIVVIVATLVIVLMLRKRP